MRLSFLVFLLLLAACTRKEKAPLSLAEQGQRAYARHCASCHNVNPKVDGVLGPAVFGSSLELLERRIVHGDYPPGYTPKRDTRTMAALPFAKDQIPALHAYLNSP